MKRRSFLSIGAAVAATFGITFHTSCPSGAAANLPASRARADSNHGDHKLLVLIELKGGNDGFNTVIPFSDPGYYLVRKNIAVERDRVLQLDQRTGLHPSLLPLMPLWQCGELAIVQGVGYAQPNLSHFRSTEIWDTASHSDQYLHDGWLARALARAPVEHPIAAADVVMIGTVEAGPLAGGACDVSSRHSMLKHAEQRNGLPDKRLNTVFSHGVFGSAVNTAMHALMSRDVAVIRLTLSGFDTHHNQPVRHAALLTELADGLTALRVALIELGRWSEALVITHSEFGRSARENQNRGTDHGTVAPCLAMGGSVRGGLYGMPPRFAQLDGNGSLPVSVDFRRLYATVLRNWWGLDAATVLGQRFEPLPLLRA